MSTPGTFLSGTGDVTLPETPQHTASTEESFYFRRETATPDKDQASSGAPGAPIQVPSVKFESTQTIVIGADGSDTDCDSDSTEDLDALEQRMMTSGMTSENTELLMSEQDVNDWNSRLQEMEESLQKQREDYAVWESSLSKRRLRAQERLKRLKGFHVQRVNLYSAVTGYISGMNTTFRLHRNSTV